ncbi:N-acetylglucosamine-6-phosphate deacetylase [Staphylococcus agnetis]|uniref:N-acetylglucosamine-6-phosphate deacetylase n=1 Tax=Staphylococcus agnetis TaxID=985762 RepID=UPI00208E87F5|nr:N-acetylglucosamine-6-phosphate deacetylase [Staphylococcus agnetis]MCO4339403.1 N-acetylglucosamine-6-phosphate deacetylase [Staphylococcus agnetis]MCO4345982.1 N-acetylglucosamine-6-phosphate deacetylase [Staphylococcus agnetis]MCO4347755.1 N-acetylglucosamine-6-phosphate deacetylase [Staphylococcus agnetis]MCO4350129.1 N-acetylglucosamine-6-phosphate deacetylase [Staphylococcus agnetis]MCO4355537.1 N-acetylglucosamine-6-phosphate deacetylase [Staphylococcus agnetis]
MSEYILQGGKIYTEDGVIDNGYLKIKDGLISYIGHEPYEGDLDVIHVSGSHILPGFIDIHIHGGYGHDAMDADEEGLKHLSENLLSEGTTSYLATTMTQSNEAIIDALHTIAHYQQQQTTHEAEILGVHLEGPFISEHKVGAQNPKYVQRPTIAQIDAFQKAANQLIKIITIAPEVEGAHDVIKAYSNDIIFSMGHTVATYDEANAAVQCGVKHITHLYNAATPFTHRDPGVFGAAWTNPFLRCELIGDGIHSHPTSVDIAFKMNGLSHMFLITDAMRAKGLGPGEYDLGGQNVTVTHETARLENGALAGSILKMNEGLKNLIQYTERNLEDLWRVTSYNQAKALNILHQKGSIREGKHADIVIVDDDINVLKTIKMGYVCNNVNDKNA